MTDSIPVKEDLGDDILVELESTDENDAVLTAVDSLNGLVPIWEVVTPAVEPSKLEMASTVTDESDG